MLNQILGGHYRIVQNLGKGGLAKTYIAEDLHRPGHPRCAVKFLKPMDNDPSFLPSARRLFHQEAEILEKLGQHDQIPRLLAYFEENQEFYLVQELIEGETLSMQIKTGTPWTENQVIEMLQDVLPILEFVHSYEVIHRDIKPNNLIRRRKDGRLVLIDFGAVKQIRSPNMFTNAPLTQTTISIGTQGYIPMEQLRGKPRFNSDIYALGITCIQALTGVPPLRLREDKNGEVIWQGFAEVSDELAVILSKMVRYHFQNRYQSATEVLQELQPLTNNEQIPLIISTTSDGSKVSQKLDPEGEKRKSLISPLDSLATAQDLGPIRITEVVRKPKALVNHKRLLPLTMGRRRINPIITSDGEQRKNLVPPVDLLVPSEDLKSSRRTPMLVPLNKSLLLMGAGIISVFASIFAGYSYITYKQAYLKAQEALGQIEALKEAEKYQECLQQVQGFSQTYSQLNTDSQLNTEAQSLQSDCQQGQLKKQLDQARKLAEQSRLKEAIVLATQIPTDTNFYLEAQQLISRWCEEMFQIATNKYQGGNLKEAIAIARAIPNFGPWVQKAQETIQQWNQEWNENQTHLQAAQQAINGGRWQDAINAAQKISDNDYWQKQRELIIQKAKAGIASAQAAATSRKRYQARPTSVPSSPSASSPSRSTRRSRSSTSRLRSNSTKSNATSSPPRSISTKSNSTSNLSRSISIKSDSTSIQSDSTSNPSRLDNWTCLNNPNPKCRR